MTEQRLDMLLGIWAQWMSQGQGVRGYGEKIPAIGISHSADFEDLLGQADKIAAKTVDACIDGLTNIHRASIYHMHLGAVFRFREPIERIYEAARDEIRPNLERRGVY